jgi:hypothetical protein
MYALNNYSLSTDGLVGWKTNKKIITVKAWK